MKKTYQVIFSFLLVLQSHLAFSMHEQNWVEYACGFIYGHADLVDRKVNVPLVQAGKSVEFNSVDPVEVPKHEWDEYFAAPAKEVERRKQRVIKLPASDFSQLHRNTEYNKKSLKIDTEAQGDKPKIASPKSVKFNLSPE